MSFIKKDLLKAVKEKLDNLIKFKKVLIETVDGWVIGLGLEYLDSEYADKIPVEYQDEVNLLLEAFVEDDFDKITDATSSTIDEIVNLPFMDDDFEAKWIALNVKALKDYIVWLANKNKAE